MTLPLAAATLDQLFLQARTYRGSAEAWLDRPVSDELLRRLYDLARMGPTALNGSPARFVFVRSPEGKEKLREALNPGNVAPSMAAPVTVLIGSDPDFHRQLPKLFPYADVAGPFAANPALAAETALRNSSLQGAYLMLAARALGLDCGPMSGFNQEKMDAAFFAGTSIRTNFACNLGYGNPASLSPRAPRLGFDEAARLA